MAWEFDPNHSQVDFASRHYGISTIRGTFRKVQAQLSCDGEDPTRWSIDVTVDTRSLESGWDRRDDHLRSPDFLDVERFPTIAFHGRRVERVDGRYRLVGDLTIHGVTREVALEGEFHGEVPDRQGGMRRGFSADTTIKRTDFGVGGPEGSGAAGDDVRISITMEAINREATPLPTAAGAQPAH